MIKWTRGQVDMWSCGRVVRSTHAQMAAWSGYHMVIKWTASWILIKNTVFVFVRLFSVSSLYLFPVKTNFPIFGKKII